ncbi:MAG TPA: M24 family metallopeptidase [Clostridia bacterium]|nr:M24 family metallopeptidase [Clostridia bacterium]
MQSKIIKSAEEIEIIKASAKIVDDCYGLLLNWVNVGMTEIQVANFVLNTMKELGAEGVSFDTIVAFGENGCEPHHIPTSRALSSGDMVTVDMGAVLGGYCSDFTRTFAYGKPNAEMLEIYDIVKTSQSLSLKAVKAGERCFDIDKICRDYIAENGYGEKYIHGTGHGVGLLIHEAPTLNRKSEEILEDGMVITIEPGIYVQNLGGVRIEDMVIVGENVPLSIHSRELIVLG